MKNNPFKNRSILSATEFTPDEVLNLMEYTREIEQRYKQGRCADLLCNKILATLFFEPSTRTRLSFESAMLRLGGQVITVEQGSSTSANKGESLEDTARTVSYYADVIAMRHPEAYSVLRFAANSAVPVLNAGDGANEHPTQAFLDFYTIYKAKKNFPQQKITIGFVGDLKNSRTAHSLLQLLKYFSLQIVLVSAPEIKLPEELLNDLKVHGCVVKEISDLNSVIHELDVLYAIRIQRERFTDINLYNEVKKSYRINLSLLEKSKTDLVILHPLPRVDEIDPSVDDDLRAHYFHQVENGLYLRMALLAAIFDK